MSLYRRKDCNIWWMSLTIKGIRKRISTGTANKRRAELIHAKTITDIQDGRWFEKQKAQTITFRELVDKYMAKYQKVRDKHTLRHLLPYFGDMTLAEIQPETVEDYILKRERSDKHPAASTIHKEFGLGRRLFNLARKRWRMVETNPFADVEFSELMIIDNMRNRWLRVDEEAKLLTHAETQDLKDIIVFALNTGCRRGEILSLEWKQNIDFKRRLLTIQSTKHGKLKSIPMSETLFKMLQTRSKVQHISGKVFTFTPHGLRHWFDKAVRAAELDDFHFHDLRHTFATRLVQAGVDLYRVKELLGHKTIQTTERYAHHYPESLRDSVKVLDSCHDLVTVNCASEEKCFRIS